VSGIRRKLFSRPMGVGQFGCFQLALWSFPLLAWILSGRVIGFGYGFVVVVAYYVLLVRGARLLEFRYQKTLGCPVAVFLWGAPVTRFWYANDIPGDRLRLLTFALTVSCLIAGMLLPGLFVGKVLDGILPPIAICCGPKGTHTLRPVPGGRVVPRQRLVPLRESYCHPMRPDILSWPR